MNKTMLNEAVREALKDIPNEVAHHPTAPPQLEDIYVVPGHEKALNPETPLVVGDRGSGKSFWCAALNGDNTRSLIGQQFTRLHLEACGVSWGFSAQRAEQGHPSRQVLNQLQRQGLSVEGIWRTVILQHLLPLIGESLPGANWQERTLFVENNPEKEEAWLAQVDQQLRDDARRHLIVFDALDRLGDDWASIRSRLKGLLRVCLDLRGFSNIRTKLFMRPDMWEDKALWAFPDASKLHHGCVMLEWRRVDLYGLLWHWLSNHNQHQGARFREWCEMRHNQEFHRIGTESKGFVHILPQAMRTEESCQAAILNDIASLYMGTNRRRGKTYTWLPTHLADAKGKISPRSFLLAIKRAQEASEDKGAEEVLHYDGIKKGVSEASRVRVQELREDYAWIDDVFPPLKGLSVPVAAAELIERWRHKGVIAKVEQPQAHNHQDEKNFLPPHAMENLTEEHEREEALIQALIEIGVMNRIPDGRLNIPDLFRVAAGIGRRGGVRAIK